MVKTKKASNRKKVGKSGVAAVGKSVGPERIVLIFLLLVFGAGVIFLLLPTGTPGTPSPGTPAPGTPAPGTPGALIGGIIAGVVLVVIAVLGFALYRLRGNKQNAQDANIATSRKKKLQEFIETSAELKDLEQIIKEGNNDIIKGNFTRSQQDTAKKDRYLVELKNYFKENVAKAKNVADPIVENEVVNVENEIENEVVNVEETLKSVDDRITDWEKKYKVQKNVKGEYESLQDELGNELEVVLGKSGKKSNVKFAQAGEL